MQKADNVQDVFLNKLRQEKIQATIFLTNGVQIRGAVRSFDNFVIELDSDGRQQVLYKHAVSTIVPAKNVKIYTE